MKKQQDKKVTGLYGEMLVAMKLHRKGWQVYRAYIDEKFDFVIMKSYCTECKGFSPDPYIQHEKHKGKEYKCVTNKCKICEKDSLKMVVRFIQVKTSENISEKPKAEDEKKFDFTASQRYHIKDDRMFYVWVAVWDDENVHFYVFKPNEIKELCDNASYHTMDNNAIPLRISKDGEVRTKGKKYDYTCFKGFKNNFCALDEVK